MPWYVEEWTDDDIVDALKECDVPITEENITKLRNACLHLLFLRNVPELM